MKVNQKLSLDQVVSVYSTYVQTISHLESRRASASTFFVTLSAALLAAREYSGKVSVTLSVGLLIVAVVWLLVILSHRKLSYAKFQVLKELEKQLPIQPFALEEKHLKGKNYWGLTYLELLIPIFLILFFGIQILCSAL